MNTYYVYTVKSNNKKSRRYVFVDDPIEFANEAFEPDTMAYTGVAIEADNLREAADVYNCPQGDDGYMMADEPRATAFMTRMHGESKQETKQLDAFSDDLHRSMIHALSKSLKHDLVSVNRLISEIARQVHAIHPSVPTMSVYRKLKQNIAEELMYIRQYTERFTNG